MLVFSVAFPVVASSEEPPGKGSADEEDRDADPEGHVDHEVVDVSDLIQMGVHGVCGGVVGKFRCFADRVVYLQIVRDDL